MEHSAQSHVHRDRIAGSVVSTAAGLTAPRRSTELLQGLLECVDCVEVSSAHDRLVAGWVETPLGGRGTSQLEPL